MAKPERQPESYLELARDNTLTQIAKLKPDPGGRMSKSVVNKLYPDHAVFHGLDDPEATEQSQDTVETEEIEKPKLNGSARTLINPMQSYYESLMADCKSKGIDPEQYHFLRYYRPQATEHTNGNVTTNSRINRKEVL